MPLIQDIQKLFRWFIDIFVIQLLEEKNIKKLPLHTLKNLPQFRNKSHEEVRRYIQETKRVDIGSNVNAVPSFLLLYQSTNFSIHSGLVIVTRATITTTAT